MPSRVRRLLLALLLHSNFQTERRVETRPEGSVKDRGKARTGGKGRAQRPLGGGMSSLALFLLLLLLLPFFSIPLLPAPRRLPSTYVPASPYLSLAQETSGRAAESGRGRVGVQGRGRPFGGGYLAFGSDDDRRANRGASSSAGSGGPGGARGAGHVGRAAQGGLHLLLMGRIQRSGAWRGELRGEGGRGLWERQALFFFLSLFFFPFQPRPSHTHK